ncbi:MAG: SDR family NAD(P)-dependent oxidoreductase [Actinomycetota bacterium]
MTGDANVDQLRRFEGRRALVTGASRGIGAAIAERLAAEGADVALVARTRSRHAQLEGSLEETAARCESHGARTAVVVADITKIDDRERLVTESVDGLGGPIDVLVNNAAAAIYQPMVDYPLKRRHLTFEANVHAPLDLAQAVLPPMIEAGEGWILNLSSGTARPWDGPPFEVGSLGTTIAVYGASKAALDRLTNGLGAELFGTGVRVNAVQPRAAVLSEGAAKLAGKQLRPDQVESIEQMVEGSVVLACCDADVTGRSTVSLDNLVDFGLDVRGLDARPLG